MIELAPGVRVSPDELVYRATASGGPGGQNVNKVATRIELIWDLTSSPSLSDFTRRRLLERLKSKLDSEGRLRIVASEHRSQSQNREAALERLRKAIAEALKPRKKRKPTAPTRASKERRLQQKKQQSERKQRRRRDDY